MVSSAPRRTCARCGSEVALAMLACPACGKLVHTEDLEKLSREAEERTAAGDVAGALAAWRQAVELLPRATRQHDAVLERIRALEPHDPSATEKPRSASPWGSLAAIAALLVGGLSKLGTVLSMAAMVGVYWASFGWKFAFGVVGSIYVHEMGHVALLRRYGIAATAPMFVPGVGAFVRLKQYPPSPKADAHVGLAGPIWGLAAAVVAKAIAVATGSGSWAAIAEIGALINLFNLIPIGSLDGGRGLRSLSRGQRLALALVCGAAWAATHHWLPALIGLVTLVRSPGPDAPSEPDWPGLARFVVLIVALCALGTKLI